MAASAAISKRAESNVFKALLGNDEISMEMDKESFMFYSVFSRESDCCELSNSERVGKDVGSSNVQ